MARILLIETSASVCSVGLGVDGKLVALREEHVPNRHAELLSVFCEEIMGETNSRPSDLNAVAISGGPGSYTGLRIGTSTAKGYCFALNIPLISIPTLESMARGMRNVASSKDLFCPMMDARRMEIYSATYTHDLQLVKDVIPVILDETSFEIELSQGVVWFSGDGMEKSREILSKHPNARFTDQGNQSAKHLVEAAEMKFRRQEFEDLAYYVPFYLKTFNPGPKRSNL